MYKQVNMYEDNTENVISIKHWLGIHCLMIIPFLNVILAIVLSFTSISPTKKNYFRAMALMLIVNYAFHGYELAKYYNLIA